MIKMATDKNSGKLAKWTIGEDYMKLVLKKTEEFYKSTEEQNWDLAKLKVTSLKNLTSYYIREKGRTKDITKAFDKLDDMLDKIKIYHNVGKFDEEKQQKREIIDTLYYITEEINIIFAEYGAYLIISKSRSAVEQSLMM
jgi:soluble cytochrome b562